MGKGGKAQTIGYKYYLGMHLGMCHGPIDAVTRLSVDDRVVWSGYNTGGSINVNATDVFGGDKREGGVSGTIDIAMGGPAQGQNSYLVSKLGSLIPAYRGVLGLIFRQCYLGNNPYLKTWSARGQRILTRQGGIEQWYPEKAVVVGTQLGGSPYASYDFDLDAVDNATTNAATALAIGYSITVNSPYDVLVVTLPSGRTYQSYTYDGTPIKGAVYNSGCATELRAKRNGGAIADAWVGEGYWPYGNNSHMISGMEAARAAFGERQMTGATQYTFYIYDAPVDTNTGGLSPHIDVYPGVSIDMNPAHIIRECLTDPDWGMGYTDADIDDVSFTQAADTFYSEGLGLSLLWDKQIKIDDFVQTVLRHVDAALYVSRTTGKFVLKPIRGGYDEGLLLLLDESNIVSVDDPTRITFGELTNSVTVNYWDANTGKDASVTVTDTALVQQQGAVINAPLQYPGFTNARNATVAAQRDLRALSSPLLSCTITADSDAKVLNIGDVFKFSWSRWGLSEVVMRVTGIAYGTGRNNRVKISCTQDVFDTDTNVVIVVPNPGWEDPSAPPSAVVEQMVTEAPYFELVQALGQADIDNKLLTHPEIGYVIAAASRPTSAINANLYTDNGTGYEDVGAMDFSPAGELADNIGKLDTTLFVDSGQDLAEVALGTHVQVGEELMRVDAIDDETGEVTVGRGVLDTVPQDHLAGEPIFFWDAYAGFDPTEYVDAEEVDVKIVPTSGAGVLPIEDAVAMSVTLASRAARPYAPGDFRINGESYTTDAFYEGEVEVTWTDRDRLQQTSGTLVDHTAGNIGPEAGTTYRLRVYVDEVLDQTIEPAVSPQLVTPGGSGEVRIEVHSLRDGLYSWQAPSHTFLNAGFRLTEDNDVRYLEDNDVRVIED